MPQTTIYVSPRSLGAPDARPPAVVTDDLARLFAGSAALAGVSIQVEPGRCVALLGPNGAGKTTLLRILATAIRPTYGTAAVDGLDVGSHARLVRQRVAFLSHATGLYDDLSARENLRFAATLLGTPDAEARVARALTDVELTDDADRRVRGFSAGMRRRVALARILLAAPSVVLLDEPYAALDPAGMDLVDTLLGAWRDVGVTVLVASHAVDRLGPHADATLRLSAGTVAEIRGEGVASAAPVTTGGGIPVVAGAER